MKAQKLNICKNYNNLNIYESLYINTNLTQLI